MLSYMKLYTTISIHTYPDGRNVSRLKEIQKSSNFSSLKISEWVQNRSLCNVSFVCVCVCVCVCVHVYHLVFLELGYFSFSMTEV